MSDTKEIAIDAEFFSFGTNDLTQTTMGLSRDDYTKFSKEYENLKIFKADPFAFHDEVPPRPEPVHGELGAENMSPGLKIWIKLPVAG